MNQSDQEFPPTRFHSQQLNSSRIDQDSNSCSRVHSDPCSARHQFLESNSTRLRPLDGARDGYGSREEDLSFFEDTNKIQQQFTLYEYEYNKNYKSWGSNVKGDMMSNKEYMLIWEWFRDTIYGVEKEEGVLVKTLAYYCVANEVFEDMYEAFTFFNLMTLSMDNLVLSFTELINVVTNPSIEQSNKLRLHIRSKKRRNEKKVKTVKTPSDKEPEKVVVEMEKSCFLPNFTHKRPSNAAITQNSDKGGCIDSGTSKDNPTANTNFLPQISSSRKSNQTETHANSEGIYRHALNPKHASDSSLHPAGRLHTIGRVFRRQLSRMASRDVDTSNGDEVASESATQTSEEDNLCIKKEKKQTKKQAKKQTKKQTKKETKNKDIQRQSSLQFF
jgi:hypothetical protein